MLMAVKKTESIDKIKAINEILDEMFESFSEHTERIKEKIENVEERIEEKQ